MTLGGLAAAVGLVIDDAIVVVENIVLPQRRRAASVCRPSIALCGKLRSPLIGSTITPIVVSSPLISIAWCNRHVLPRLGRHRNCSATHLAGSRTHMDSELEPVFHLIKTTFWRKNSYGRGGEITTDPTFLAAEEALSPGVFGQIVSLLRKRSCGLGLGRLLA